MLYASVLSASLALDGAPVAEDAVRSAAVGFLRRSSAAQRILPGRIVSSLAARGNLWIVSLSPSGHVVFAGSDKCSPVVSFSPDDFAEPEAGSALYVQLQNVSDWVAEEEADESAAVDSGWAKYTATDTKKRLLSAAPSGATVGDGYDDFVNPFLGANWSQGAPMTDLTPLTSPCGCAATAGGQEFRHWRWPYRFEKSRSFTHALRDSYNNALNYTMRPDGRVPIDWDKVAASGTTSTPWETDKEVGYNTAFLTMWMQTMVNMGFKAGGSYATRKLCSDAENYWYEAGKVMSQGRDGYDNLWCAITNDLKFGSPIQINTPVHQMVIDGYAIENVGTDSEIDYVNTNYGWGNGIRWENLKTAIESGGGAGKFADFQVGFRPQKIVQFEPLAKVSTGEVTLKWHIAPCYTNRTTGFTVQIAKTGGETATETVATHDETTVWTASGLDDGGEYTFTVTPVMADGSEARANSVATTIGTPQPAPEIAGVSSVACGIDLVQQGFYIECARAITNYIAVTCNESTTALEAYSSHLTILPDEKISVSKNGSVFTIAVDATEMDAKWNGEMLLLTLVAKNADGTEAYKNLMLRFNGMRQVLGGTFEMVETNPTTPVWFCGTTTLDAKGQNITFGANAFQGNGCDVTLTDSVGGGSFTFASLDGFTGTLHITSAAAVNLPSDMSRFCGTLAYDRCYTDNTFHYTLSRDLPATATVYLPQYTMLYLDNVTVDAAFTGKGAVYITSGSSTLSNTAGFSGTVELGDFESSDTLTLSAGEEPGISIWNGTLFLTLSREQVAYGYSTSQIKYNWGTVVFQDEDGNELKRWTTDDKTFAVDPSANTWTPDAETGTGRFNDAARWSRGSVPSAGELVIFNDNFGDTEMTLDLSSDFALAHVKVIGTRFTIKSSGTGKLSVDTFENTVPTKLATTNIAPATVVPRGKLFVQTGLTISCDIDSSLAQNLRDISDAMSALIWDDGDDYCIWRGTVVFKDYAAAYLNLNEWGHSRSSVRFNGVTGHISSGKTYDVPVELADNGSTVALNWNNGSSGATTTFAKIYGAGTFKTTAGGGNNENVLVKDALEFTGSFQLAAKNVIFGGAAPSSDLGSNGRLHILTNATVAAGAIWNIGGGVYLGTDCNLTVRGRLLSTGTAASIKTLAEGTAITFEDGSLLRTAVALSGDYSPAINFKAATWQATQNRTETKTVNFCAPAGSYTTLDANGSKITLGPDFFSGAGDVYLTSSADGGSFVIQGLSSAYTGTIYTDITAGLTMDDMTASSGRVSISDAGLSISSAKLGNVIVGTGATLTISLTDRQAMKGFAASSVTLAGGTIEFVDQYGTVVGSSTESTTYVKPEGYTLAPVPTAVWVSGEFADEPELHGGYSVNYLYAGDTNATGNIVIGTTAYGTDPLYGVTIALPANTCKKASILVKFKVPDGNTHLDNTAIAGVVSTDGNPIYARFASSGNNIATGAYLNSGNSYAVAGNYSFNSPTISAGEGYMLFAYESEASTLYNGTAFYTGSSIDTMTGGNAGGLQWKGRTLKQLSIGGLLNLSADGVDYSLYSGKFNPWTGLEIEAVALFVDEWFSSSSVEFYEFPAAETPAPAYDGPAPAAVWVAGEFGDHKSVHAGCQISLNGNTTNALGQIVIGDGTTLGATIAVPDYDQVTVLVKYSIPYGGAPAPNAVPAAMFVNYDLGPVATASGSSNLTGYYYNNGVIANYPFATTPSLPQEGYLLISAPANSNGSTSGHYAAAYAGATTSSLTGGEAASLRFTGPNNRVTKIGVGGPTKAGAAPWAGMVIEGVALFDSWVEPDDVAGYTFPEQGAVQPEDAATLSIADNVTWNFAAGATRTYESIGALSASGTIAVTNDTVDVGVYKLAEWTTPQTMSAGYGRVGTLSVPNLPSNLTAELVYGVNAIYLRVYDETVQFLKPALKVWPYGDSITEGFNAGNSKANYRVLIGQKLKLLGYNVAMVGCYDKIQTASGTDNFMDAIDPSGAVIPDEWKWHSAKHGGTLGVTSVTSYQRSAMVENVDTLCAQAGNPDVVLLHGGINDLSVVGDAATVFANWTNVVWRILEDLPQTKIVVSTTLYTTYANKATLNARSDSFNELVEAQVAKAEGEDGAFPAGRVYLADLNTYVKSTETGVLSSDGLHPDWRGHDQMAEGFLSQVTNIFPSANGPFNSYLDYVDDSSLGAAAKTELDGYRNGFTLAQTITVASTNAPTVVNGEGPATNIGKVGYFVEYVRADNEAHKWVWVDMDAFAPTLADLGLPTTNRQQVVTSLHVKSNHNGIDNIATDDNTATGWIEFTPFDYTGAASGLDGAPVSHGGNDKSMFDWNDTLGESGTMGSMQVFRLAPPSGRPAQALFAYNNWQSSSAAAEFGIGNFAQHFWGGAQTLDYTNTKDLEKMNAAAYRVKRIEIWTKEAPSNNGKATVVRVHPRLTRGLAREALLGIRFDNAQGGNASAFDVKFRLVNCTKADITDIKYWKQPFGHNYGFYEAEAKQGPAATVSAADDATAFTASFPAGSVWFYPQVGTREDSDYLWVTATINPEISPDAQIWVSVPTAKITLSNGGVFDVVNGAETAPHRVFPFVHQIGAYLRQDGTALTGESAGKLEDSPANRVGNLTDIVVCNDFLVAYDSVNDTFKTTWDARGRDNTAQVARIRVLRDQYNPKCMIRASLTKGAGTITVDDVTGTPIACAAASAARRKQLVNAILAVMESAGLDGLDIDWEYPGDHAVTDANTKRDWHSYGLLLRDLAAAFFDKGYVLSFCSNLGYQMAPSDYHAAFHAADFVNVMAYGNTTLNASPQVMMTGINVCTSRGVPPRRIVVGQAMYAYEVQNPGWGTVVPWLKEAWPNDKTRWWDADLIWMDRSVTKADGTVLSTNKETFEGPSSYHAKCNWCRANGYGGVMSWGYYTDVSWDDADLMSLARHQAKSCWPRENWSWSTPPQDSDGAYLLDSEEDWFWLRENPGVNARFAADIALTHDPLPIETFSGTLDGAGHTLSISNDVWLAYDANPALIRTLTGTVKNLAIDLYGRVVSRASRWNDTTASKTANTLASGTHNAAVLAANLGAGGAIDGVELFIRSGAEVQGPQRVAGLAASVWVADGNHAEIRNSSVHVEGIVRSLARNTAEGDITVQYQVAGGLAGWVACPGARNIVVTNNIVSLASTGRVAVETGSSSSAGGVIGDLNNGKPLVQGNAVYVASGARVSANESAAAGKVRTSYANASYSISSSANAGQTTFFIEDGAAALAESVGGTGKATVEVSSYDGGAAADGLSVDAVAGFWYSVIYGDRLVSGGIGGETGETEPVKAPSTGPLALETPKEGATRFYRVKVSPRGN